jgi:hypothetical protein
MLYTNSGRVQFLPGLKAPGIFARFRMIRFLSSLLKSIIDDGIQYPVEEKMRLSFTVKPKSNGILASSIGEYAISVVKQNPVRYAALMTNVFVEEGWLNGFGQVAASFEAGDISLPKECLFETEDAAKAACQANFDSFLLLIFK